MPNLWFLPSAHIMVTFIEALFVAHLLVSAQLQQFSNSLHC